MEDPTCPTIYAALLQTWRRGRWCVMARPPLRGLQETALGGRLPRLTQQSTASPRHLDSRPTLRPATVIEPLADYYRLPTPIPPPLQRARPARRALCGRPRRGAALLNAVRANHLDRAPLKAHLFSLVMGSANLKAGENRRSIAGIMRLAAVVRGELTGAPRKVFGVQDDGS